MQTYLFQIFVIGFLLNLIWEFAHCQLYETCRRQTWAENTPLLIKMSLKDGLFIVLFYAITAWLFNLVNILDKPAALLLFLVMALGFAFTDERISIRLKRWEYAPAMPRILGVGLTPLLELAVTGLIALVIVLCYLS